MTDAEAIGVLGTRFSLDFHGVRNLDEKVCAAIFHCMQAISDRAALIERVDTVPLPDGVCIAIDVVKRHMRGEE